MMIGKDEFKKATGVSEALALRWSMVVSLAAAEFGIVTEKQIAMWLATLGHESGGFTRVVENMNYSAANLLRVFPKYYDPALAAAEANKPELIGNRVYGGRMGNTAPGDGFRYRGRGLIQITGKNNYDMISKGLVRNFVAEPEALQEDENAARSAGFYWQTNGLLDVDDFLKTQQRVNGSRGEPNGWNDRLVRYRLAANVLGAE